MKNEITGPEPSDWYRRYKEHKAEEEKRLKVLFELEKHRASNEARRL